VPDLKPAILEPIITSTEVISSFEEVKSLLKKIRTLRGYISITNNNKVVKKTYGKLFDYNWKQNVLVIEGEDKAI